MVNKSIKVGDIVQLVIEENSSLENWLENCEISLLIAKKAKFKIVEKDYDCFIVKPLNEKIVKKIGENGQFGVHITEIKPYIYQLMLFDI